MNRLETEARPYIAAAAYFPDTGIIRLALDAVVHFNFANNYSFVESETGDRFRSLRVCFIYLLGHEMAHFYQHLGGYYPEIFGSTPPHYHDEFVIDYRAKNHKYHRILSAPFFEEVVTFAITHLGWLTESYYPKLEVVSEPFPIWYSPQPEVKEDCHGVKSPALHPQDSRYNLQSHEVGAQITGNQLVVACGSSLGLPLFQFGYHRYQPGLSWVEDKDLPIEHRGKADPG